MNFYQYLSRLTIYLISVVSSVYVVFSVFAENSSIDSTNRQNVALIFSFILICIYANAFLFTYFRKKLILYELGLVTQGTSKEIKQIEETNLFRANIRSFFTSPVILAIISSIFNLEEIIMNFHLYLNLALILTLISLIIIIQGGTVYLHHVFNKNASELKERILSDHNIKSGTLEYHFSEN
ncbi:hypothetical protein CEE45_04860 [Candidatus Heimdallarchaeota archaeon B3_Heim]|nr:MAG: hypothetical protein CEE45_04860 [Candidatus Heimdallarchaeota archaeon B3_Heim]